MVSMMIKNSSPPAKAMTLNYLFRLFFSVAKLAKIPI